MQVVSSDGKKVRRLHPLPVPEVRDSKVLVTMMLDLLIYPIDLSLSSKFVASDSATPSYALCL